MKKVLTVILWTLLGAVSVVATPPDVAPYLAYLNALTTLDGRFIQENPDGSVDEGVFYLSRPGRMRLDYDVPNPLQIVVKDEYFVQYNRATHEANYLATADTPAAFLLSRNINVEGEVYIKDMKTVGGFIQITLRKQDIEGELILIFTPPPISLRQWMVIDGSGQITKVTLQNAVAGKPLAETLFKYPG